MPDSSVLDTLNNNPDSKVVNFLGTTGSSQGVNLSQTLPAVDTLTVHSLHRAEGSILS